MTITEQIAELNSQLLACKGREVEVFTRIVGYYRPVSLWNKGKTAEKKERKEFVIA